MESKTKNQVHWMAMTAVMAAVLAVIAPFALPIGPVPISLCTLAIYFAVYVLGWRRGTMAVVVYVLLGAVGLPVFSNFAGGLGKLAGPTGGYIIGYIPLALIAGWFVHRFPRSRAMQLLGMVLATAVLYALGTAWICVQAGYEVAAALGVCVFPFVPGDLVKIAAALAVGPVLQSRLAQAKLSPAG